MCAEDYPDFGILPDQAQFDADWLEKCQMAIDDPEIELNPVNNIVDFVDVALEILIVEWCTRGCLEPISIVKEDFERSVIEESKFAGIPYIRLKENHRGQKRKKLSLKDSNSNRKNGEKRTLPCPYNQQSYLWYQMTIWLLEMVLDNCIGPNCIFQQPTAVKQVKVRI